MRFVVPISFGTFILLGVAAGMLGIVVGGIALGILLLILLFGLYGMFA